MGSAKFPIHRDFSGFDFGQSIVDQLLINKLTTMKFTDAAQNLVLVGGTGTGKTHLATALGVSGIQNHSKRVRFYSTVELVNTLEQEKAAGKQGRLALSLMQVHYCSIYFQSFTSEPALLSQPIYRFQNGIVCLLMPN